MLARARDAARDEGGFSVVEGIVAAMILAIGVLGTLQLFDAGARGTYRAEESQVLNDRLQAELEAVKQLPYDQIALTSQPTNAPDANDPAWRVSGTKFAITRTGSVSSRREMAFNGTTAPGGETISGGVVDPGPEPFTAGDVSGEIYRFVTWANPENCPTCAAGMTKRIIVAARIDEAPISYERAFSEVQTDVVDPDATPDENPAPPDDPEDSTTAQFWLTDTACNESGRVPTSADHPAHNTRGQCSTGGTTGATRGAPDLMHTEAPSVEESPGTTLFDYATDVEPAPGGDDKGLLMPEVGDVGNCLLQPVLNLTNVKQLLEGGLSALDLGAPPGVLDGVLDLTSGTDPQYRMHTWLSPQIANQNGVVLTGLGSLELFTQTIDGATHSGEICAYLFVRQTVAIPRCLLKLAGVCVSMSAPVDVVVDIPLVNVGVLSNGDCSTGTGLNLTNFQYSQDPWPSNWAQVSMPMCFVAVNSAGVPIETLLPKDSQLGLTLMVKDAGTGAGLEFMYDRVGFESRLEVQTESLIAFE
jgi:hypothetical protein